MSHIIGRGRYARAVYPRAAVASGSSGSTGGSDSTTPWALYTPTFDVIGSVGAQLGDGELTGRYRQDGPDSIQVQQFLVWGSTSSWGAAPVPTYNLTVPAGFQLTIDNVLQDPPGVAGVLPVTLSGILGGTVSQGSVFFCSIFDFSGLKCLIGIPAALKNLFQNGDRVLIAVDLTIVEP